MEKLSRSQVVLAESSIKKACILNFSVEEIWKCKSAGRTLFAFSMSGLCTFQLHCAHKSSNSSRKLYILKTCCRPHSVYCLTWSTYCQGFCSLYQYSNILRYRCILSPIIFQSYKSVDLIPPCCSHLSDLLLSLAILFISPSHCRKYRNTMGDKGAKGANKSSFMYG